MRYANVAALFVAMFESAGASRVAAAGAGLSEHMSGGGATRDGLSRARAIETRQVRACELGRLMPADVSDATVVGLYAKWVLQLDPDEFCASDQVASVCEAIARAERQVAREARRRGLLAR